MPRQFVDHRTAGTIYRYSPAEMSGPLPSVLYKYLRLDHARALIDHGEMMFSTLAWFQHLEDPDRGDGFEGTHKYFPAGGLQVTRTARAGQPLLVPNKFTLPSDSLRSKAKGRDHIFIYSTSLQPGLTQFDESAAANPCVVIHDPAKLLARLRGALARWTPVRAATLIHDEVQYWSPVDPPGSVHALPDRLTMNKHEDFRSQHEYRFAFGTQPGVFDFENVEYQLVREGHREPRPHLDPAHHRTVVRIGSLTDCCRLA